MADEPLIIPIYQVRAESTEHRQDIRRRRREQRAEVMAQLVTMMEEGAKATLMASLLQLEDLHAREDQALTDAWLRDVQAAYLQGRAEVADEQVQAITGEPPVVETKADTTLH